MTVDKTMFYLAKEIITGILIVHVRKFVSIQEAEEWNERTGVCPNFSAVPFSHVLNWKGKVIWVPMHNAGEDDEC
jgi:hypothetical protein